MKRFFSAWALGVVSTLSACGGAAGAPPDARPVEAPEAPTPTPSSEPARAAPEPEASEAPPAPSPAPADGPRAGEEDRCIPASVGYEKEVRPKLKACYREAKAKAPNLEGAVRFVLDVDTLGKPKPVRVTEKSLPDALVACMVKAFKATPFTEAGSCPGKTLTIPVQFPTPP